MIVQHFTYNDIQTFEQRYKAQFINSLSGFKSANLIGSHDVNANSNLGIFSSVVHIGSNPALVGFIMRPDNGERHTLNNIINTQQYTINQVSTEHYRMAHQCSARYASDESEFNHTGLTPQYVANINAPFVKESRLKYALTLQEILPISLNNTQLIIGEIIHVICQKHAIQPDGYIDIESLSTASLSGLDSYHTSNRISRLSYAKPNKALSALNVMGATVQQDEQITINDKLEAGDD
ncbi:flavin reductase family protein [Catenovulum maritimum]|uniref:Flavin reductase like domain-containing protein n=1 Tax=Catenovulum maritimum TaxID=1513271 RepID=A0A0J8GLT5_9ALTE|nr:flavin reductase [Catenovulum maritimum]KMT63782.1 hypothetical protein XM47_17940 [Catenovulum maritimum]